MSDAVISYSPYCKHCLDVTKNEIGETVAFCEEWDLWRNVTLGDCFGNCEDQIVVGNSNPLEWKEYKNECKENP